MRYEDVIRRDNPIAYWPLAETGGTVMRAIVGPDGTHDAAVKLAAEPAPMGGRAAYFGTAGSSVALNLSAQTAITVEMWIKPNGAAGSARVAEFQSDWSDTPGSFLIQYDGFTAAGGTGSLTAAHRMDVANASKRWVHVMFYLNRATGAAAWRAMANGRQQPMTVIFGSTSGGAFANGTLLVGRYKNGALQPLCAIAHLAIYAGDLTSRALAHWRAGLGRQQGARAAA